jgi:hypothetical protein
MKNKIYQQIPAAVQPFLPHLNIPEIFANFF